MSKRKRAKAAARAAKRIPIIGTTVVLLPLVEAGTLDSNLFSAGGIGDPNSWKGFFTGLKNRYTGIDSSGRFSTSLLLTTYGPIVAYLIARRFAGKHISRVFRPLGVKF